VRTRLRPNSDAIRNDILRSSTSPHGPQSMDGEPRPALQQSGELRQSRPACGSPPALRDGNAIEQFPLPRKLSFRGQLSAICASGYLSSPVRLGRPLPPKCPEVILGTAGSVFFYLSPFRYPNTGCGLLFAHSLELEHKDDGLATPFDSGGLLKNLTRHNPAESPQDFLARHELPIPEHRRYLCRSPRRRNLWVTDTLQWRRKLGSLSPRTCAGFSSLLFVASCLLNQLLPPVNAQSDRADPGKCQQRALCGS
jgi:hypothetical protein